MTPSQILKQSLGEIDKKFSLVEPEKVRFIMTNSTKIILDNSSIKSFIKSHTLSLIRAERERLEGMKRQFKNAVDELGRPVEPTEAFEIRADREWNRCLKDQINFLVQQEKEIEEL